MSSQNGKKSAYSNIFSACDFFIELDASKTLRDTLEHIWCDVAVSPIARSCVCRVEILLASETMPTAG